MVEIDSLWPVFEPNELWNEQFSSYIQDLKQSLQPHQVLTFTTENYGLSLGPNGSWESRKI